jgi:hypothetical protein
VCDKFAKHRLQGWGAGAYYGDIAFSNGGDVDIECAPQLVENGAFDAIEVECSGYSRADDPERQSVSGIPTSGREDFNYLHVAKAKDE